MKINVLHGNQLRLLTSGAEFFPALIAAVDAAVCEVHLETYLFADDATGNAVAAAFIRAAERGVLVRVLVDGFGSSEFTERLLPKLRAGKVQALIYRADIAPFALRKRRLRRMHRKLAVIDGRIGFVGGINIIDDDSAGADIPRHDYAVQIEGPLLEPIHRAVRRMWEIVTWASFRRRYRPRPEAADYCATVVKRAGHNAAAFVLRDNLLRRHDIEDAYLGAIAAARHSVLIANAYFLPGHRFRQALIAAAQRGVRVSLLLQGRAEYRLQHWATQALYPGFIKAGIRITEYQRGYLHAKVAVIDDYWATVGSSNIDPFSLLLAKEANVVCYGADFAKALRSSLERVIAEESAAISSVRWQRLSLWQRGLRWMSYQLIRVALGLAGYARRHDGR